MNSEDLILQLVDDLTKAQRRVVVLDPAKYKPVLELLQNLCSNAKVSERRIEALNARVSLLEAALVAVHSELAYQEKTARLHKLPGLVNTLQFLQRNLEDKIGQPIESPARKCRRCKGN